MQVFIYDSTPFFVGANPDKHVLRAAGPVLDARAGRAAAVHRHGGHEPVDHRPAPRLQARQEENHRHSQPQANVRRGNFI